MAELHTLLNSSQECMLRESNLRIWKACAAGQLRSLKVPGVRGARVKGSEVRAWIAQALTPPAVRFRHRSFRTIYSLQQGTTRRLAAGPVKTGIGRRPSL